MNPKQTEIFTAIDLELAQPSNKIISIGYCIGNIKTKEILASDDLFVMIDEPLTDYIIKLTGITDEKLANEGEPLLVQYEKLRSTHIAFDSFINCLTWGGGDTQFLGEQLKASGVDFKWCFGRRWIDVKTIYIGHCLANGFMGKGGLANSMKKMGLKFSGQKHSSKDDAINTFLFFCHLLERLKK